ncbi:MAG: hypothetical protein AAGC81_14495 [Pseudomonadota bacterium]
MHHIQFRRQTQALPLFFADRAVETMMFAGFDLNKDETMRELGDQVDLTFGSAQAALEDLGALFFIVPGDLIFGRKARVEAAPAHLFDSSRARA